MEGWGKIKDCARYAGVSERTFRDWLKAGLKCARLPTGHLLVKFSDIDSYLEQFTSQENEADRLANEIEKELNSKPGSPRAHGDVA